MNLVGLHVRLLYLENASHKGMHNHGESRCPVFYRYSATKTQAHDNPNTALFFLERDLSPGSKVILGFTKITSGSLFICHSQVNTIHSHQTSCLRS